MAKSTQIPERYATAWLDAATERGVLPKVRQEIAGLTALLTDSAEFTALFQDRDLPPQLKQQLLTQIFQGKVEELTLNFLCLMIAKQRESLFPNILEACRVLLDQRDGILDAHVTSAIEMPAEQVGALQARLEAHTGKRIRMHVAVNPVLIGGFVAVVNDTVFDGSLVVQLQRVKRALVGR